MKTPPLEQRRQEAVERFLETCGAPRVKLGLKWTGRESFCDPHVQTVLEERHPDAVPADYPLDYAVAAWKRAEQYVRTPDDALWGELAAFAQADLAWLVRLVGAVVNYHAEAAGNAANPRKGIGHVIVWRLDHQLREWSPADLSPDELRHARVQAVALTRRLQPDFASQPGAPTPPPPADPLAGTELEGMTADQIADLGVKPVSMTAAEPPAKYLEGYAGKYHAATSAARKAVHDENARRTAVMERWARPWLVHLGLWPE